MSLFNEDKDTENENIGISEIYAERFGEDDGKDFLKEQRRKEKEAKKAEKEARKAARRNKNKKSGAQETVVENEDVENTDTEKSAEEITQGTIDPLSDLPQTETTSESAGNDNRAEVEENAPEENVIYKGRRKSERPEDINIVKDLINILIYMVALMLICFLINAFIGQRTSVSGTSMFPTLDDKDNLWISKISYTVGDPERYDIVVFPFEDDVYYIKRIIGLPGETVLIDRDGNIFIDGELLTDDPVDVILSDPGIASSPIKLGDDEYFVLGDNRNNSRDSRWSDVGNIKRDRIVGKAVLRLYPFKHFGSIEDK